MEKPSNLKRKNKNKVNNPIRNIKSRKYGIHKVRKFLSNSCTPATYKGMDNAGKSPISILNEMGVKFTYSSSYFGGPAHNPLFKVMLNVDNKSFEGMGHSKREARTHAARAYLQTLDQNKARPEQKATPVQSNDFAMDSFDMDWSEIPNMNIGRKQQSPGPQNSMNHPQEAPAVQRLTETVQSNSSKSPVNLLYEMHPNLIFTCTYGDGTVLGTEGASEISSHNMRFKVTCNISGRSFDGYGSSKKMAKLAACKAALAALSETLPSVNSGCCGQPAIGDWMLPQTVANCVARLVNEKFAEVMRLDPLHAKRKVLAGIVVTTDYDIRTAKVIAVTSGTKCISGEYMSVRGLSLNDCHAEVVARRCLQKYIYDQLYRYSKSQDPSQPIEESELEPLSTGGYRWKPHRRIHLFISTAPCGDSRIFSPHEEDTIGDKHPNRLARGQLRTKIESGEGTIPVRNSSNSQTWDGVLQGERLLTMSCSDKVARWCVLGLQGALLSQLVEPVYLHSLVLGSLLNTHHMYRAICGRIEGTLKDLPQPWYQRRPFMSKAASTEVRLPTKAPNFSVNWTSGNKAPEVVNAPTGKMEQSLPSYLCKQHMYARWLYLRNKLKPVIYQHTAATQPDILRRDCEEMTYSDAKQMSSSYQVCKVRLYDAFQKANLGSWINKPLEQDYFLCELTGQQMESLFR